jgi:hypothetical protein
MQLADLTVEERLVLGGLVRVIVRADGSFSKDEEARMDRIGDELGGREVFWKAISDSAQAFRDDTAIRVAARAIARPEVHALILDVLASVAAADTISANEREVIESIRREWGAVEAPA